MKKIAIYLFTVVAGLALISCVGGKPHLDTDDADSVSGSRSGWTKVDGMDRYYITAAGQAASMTDAETLATMSTPIKKQNAVRAAEQNAQRNFLEQVVGAYMAAKTESELGTITSDQIKSGVAGTVPAPVSEKVACYDGCASVEVLFFFQGENLKQNISDQMESIISSN